MTEKKFIKKVVLTQSQFNARQTAGTLEEGVEYEISDYVPVSVSASGTSTDEVGYITIDGVEKKLGGGGGTHKYLHKINYYNQSIGVMLMFDYINTSDYDGDNLSIMTHIANACESFVSAKDKYTAIAANGYKSGSGQIVGIYRNPTTMLNYALYFNNGFVYDVQLYDDYDVRAKQHVYQIV